ncbi:RNA polymerase sigma factor [Mumia sp. zg.B17]|uniref:RNA polymerase sigma factor n=1 Tax=unclassified Mumia TaxID=2621872 RepID=UPI001C6E4D55|nr:MULTISPECIES: RNA polymerase sigma factor [unclassified Mumia]MBW9206945.1 RNA polymerase sigma factor [Mumia sp. zg.B17]MDD9350581.1 RNA polymerase sigma factor [Mumia sp.]
MTTDLPTEHAADDRMLLARTRRGDRDAFGDLYARHVRPVYWQAYRLIGTAQDAEEITQDVFITAWRRRSDINLVDTSVLPWLLATAKNVALNLRRKRGRQWEQLDDALPSTDREPSDEAVSAVLMARVRESVAGLSPLDQQLFERCVVGDLTYAQAADALGVSHAAVRNRVARIRSRVRAATEDLRGPA